jgi:oxygen-dependent protoporphyrinogen oxidase
LVPYLSFSFLLFTFVPAIAMTRRVVVVGAGISGLTCAYRLKQEGLQVTLVESGDSVGGVMQTRIENGFLCECGPNSFQNLPEAIQLIEELGIGEELVTAEAKLPRYIFYHGSLHPAPMGPGGLFSTRLLTLRGKARIFGEPWSKPNRDMKDESLAEFVTRRFGPEVLRNFVAPFVSGVYAGDPDSLSARSAFPRLVELERKHGSVFIGGLIALLIKPRKPERPRRLCSFREGLQTLPRGLAEKIGSENILLKARAESLTVKDLNGPSSFTLGVVKEGQRVDLSADAVVLAGAAHGTAELIKPLSRSLASELAAIEYPALVGACVACQKSDAPRSLNGFGFLVPRGEGVRLLGCIWNSSLFPGRAPEDSALLTVFAGGATDPEAAALDDAQIIEIVRKDLRTTLGLSATPKVVALNRHSHAIPQYTIGHEERLGRIEEELKRIQGLFLAGNYLRGVSIPDCIRQATQLAQCLTK